MKPPSTQSASTRRPPVRFPRSLAGIAILLLGLSLAFAAAAQSPPLRHHVVGDTTAPTPGKVQPGLMLMGGGDRNHEALRWFMRHAGNGHIVVLGASEYTAVDAYDDEFYREIGGIVSSETFMFDSREQATDPAMLAAIAKADGIFIMGGDQSRYVRFWRGTPVGAALDAHVRAGKPIGGTSAGLAMQGEYLYGAMDGGSQVSPLALADPLGSANTIETDFLHTPLLKGVITDSHFSERNRLGRLVAFVAKAESMAGGRKLFGLGIDEAAALAVEGDGSARVYATDPGAGATLVIGGFAQGQKEDEPMRLDRVDTVGIGKGSVLHLPEGKVDAPVFRHRYAVRDGVLVAIDAPLLVIHGGAGVDRKTMTPADEKEVRAAMTAALHAGHALLMQGKPAADAVVAALSILEDSPQFNAGKGAVFTHDGRNELDASLMDGGSGKAGAVAGVHRTRNPIQLAQAVMDHSQHVMMVGDGAEKFAQEQGIALVDPAYFRVEKRWQELQRALREDEAGQAHADIGTLKHFGTVGGLALDRDGKLAAGTSTGGMTDKRYGRVGDSPIIGAGTWADARCAVSGTGWGEYYIRAAAAHDICARVRYAGESVRKAAEAVIDKEIPAAGGDGGAIALGSDGTVAFPFNTEGMYRGWIGTDGKPHIAIYREDALPLPH